MKDELLDKQPSSRLWKSRFQKKYLSMLSCMPGVSCRNYRCSVNLDIAHDSFHRRLFPTHLGIGYQISGQMLALIWIQNGNGRIMEFSKEEWAAIYEVSENTDAQGKFGLCVEVVESN